jgi:hypothetical protein
MKPKPTISATALAILRRIAAKGESGEPLVNDTWVVMQPALRLGFIESTHRSNWFRATERGREFLKEAN